MVAPGARSKWGPLQSPLYRETAQVPCDVAKVGLIAEPTTKVSQPDS